MHETGYASKDITLNLSEDPANPYPVTLKGTDALQQEFINYIIDWAKQEKALYLINFVAIDYPKIAALPGWPEGAKIWTHTGLWDENTEAKAPLASWDVAIKASD